jgi:hypothetical protein
MIEKTLDVEVMYIDLTRSYPRGEVPVAVPHEFPLITPQRPAYPAGAIGFSQEPGSHARSCWGDR